MARKPSRVKNLSLAAIAGLSGCATLIIVFVALLGGLWLDARFGQRGPFTFGLLCLSVPVSLWAMLSISLGAIKRIEPQLPPEARRHDENESKED